ncbi:MAG TPA: VOC family protein, partial [Chryseosolibacter sp.]
MASLNPYLNFNGKTEEAFNFYKSVFGGEFTNVQRIGDTPFAKELAANEKNRIMHIALPVGSTVLMGSDILESQGHKLSVGNNCHININAETKAEADKIFKGLSAGGTVTMAL